jgi:hypothetical protein
MKVLEFGRGLDRRTASRAIVVALSLTVVLFAAITGSPRAAGVFAPTVTLETSTTRATSHPDARITIDNTASDEDIKTLSMNLPPGFWGSLAAATKCTYQNAQADNCAAASQIGTVMTTAKIDESDGLLRGKVYLTEACGTAGGDPAVCTSNASNDPAGITIIVPAKVGGVDLGKVIVNARVMAQYQGVTPANGLPAPINGVKTVLACTSAALAKDCIPNSITDSHSRTVTFKPEKLQIDLISKTTGVPLLTNPTKCSTTQLTTSIGSYDGSTATPNDDYTVTGCNTVRFKPSSFTNEGYAPTAGTSTGLHTTINFPSNSGTINRVQVALPRGMKLSTPGLGGDNSVLPVVPAEAHQCPTTSMAVTASYTTFSSALCPSQARIGSATINTPLLPTALKARVYLIAFSPAPRIGIIADPLEAGNPKGITMSFVGLTSTGAIDSTCDSESAFECWSSLFVDFNLLPDAPVTSIDLKLGTEDPGLNRSPVPTNFLQTQTNSSTDCVAKSDFSAAFTSHAGATVAAGAVSPFALTGCSTARQTTINDGPSNVAGGHTTDTTPTFSWTSSISPLYCTTDKASNIVVDESPTCEGESAGWTVPSPLAVGLHRFYLGQPSNQSEVRAFVVDSAATPDTTPPATPNITSGPTSGSTSDTTPTWNFTDAESTSFQCSIDSGAFLPCGSGSTSGTFTQPEESAFWAGSNHTIAVRAMDAAGNLSANATGSFSVDIEFNPVSTPVLSTSGARQHPDFDLTITNDSHEDIKDLSYKLPDGLFGGLTGVKSLCPITTAEAGNCTADSQVGTVETEALVDESVVRVAGQVYLTEHADTNNDPAGLSIKIRAKIQSVDLGNVIVPARLKVREHARGRIDGIDTLAINLPKEIEPDDSINPWDTLTQIDLKKMVLKLRNNPAASQPLLTNPSDCSPSAFVADFAGYDASTVNQSVPWSATGCAGLGFNPQIQASLIDTRTGKPPVASSAVTNIAARFTTTLTTAPGDANIDNASVLLPLPVTIIPSKIGPSCSIADFDADTCPANTIYGSVSAITPLLATPLIGNVYLLKQATSLPALYLRLRGPIGVDVVGHTSFENVSQIRTKFDDLPDAPLTSLSLQVDNVVSTRPNACEFSPDKWNMTGNFNANPTNGKSAAFALPLDVTCPNARFTAKGKFKKGKKSTLSVTATAQGRGGKLKKISYTLPKGVTLDKKSLAKKVTLKGDGKKLKSKCFKFKSKSIIELGLCKKQYSVVTISFKSGSLIAKKKVSKPKLKATATNASGQKQSATLDYFG